ncbi:MAG: hypothetical protein MI919_02535 [Holophagales bacterium]|nr:hypothetical protein [Holophagales bacterium]
MDEAFRKPPIRDPGVLKRMRTCFDLCVLAEDMKRQSLRREHPGWTEKQIQEGIREWYWTRPGAEHGDGPGVPAPWRFEECGQDPSKTS